MRHVARLVVPAANPKPTGRPPAGALVARPDGRRIQRAYEFAVDVAAGPPDSMFRSGGGPAL